MKKNAKITLGVMTTALIVAAPVATLVSCGEEKAKPKTKYSNIKYMKNDVRISDVDFTNVKKVKEFLKKDLKLKGFNGEGTITVPEGMGFKASVNLISGLENTEKDVYGFKHESKIKLTFEPKEGFTINGSHDILHFPTFTIPAGTLLKKPVSLNMEKSKTTISKDENDNQHLYLIQGTKNSNGRGRDTSQDKSFHMEWPYSEEYLASKKMPFYDVKIVVKHENGKVKWERESKISTRGIKFNPFAGNDYSLGAQLPDLPSVYDNEIVTITYTPMESLYVIPKFLDNKGFGHRTHTYSTTVHIPGIDINGFWNSKMGEIIEKDKTNGNKNGKATWTFFDPSNLQHAVLNSRLGIKKYELIKSSGSNAKVDPKTRQYTNLQNGDIIKVLVAGHTYYGKRYKWNDKGIWKQEVWKEIKVSGLK